MMWTRRTSRHARIPLFCAPCSWAGRVGRPVASESPDGDAPGQRASSAVIRSVSSLMMMASSTATSLTMVSTTAVTSASSVSVALCPPRCNAPSRRSLTWCVDMHRGYAQRYHLCGYRIAADTDLAMTSLNRPVQRGGADRCSGFTSATSEAISTSPICRLRLSISWPWRHQKHRTRARSRRHRRVHQSTAAVAQLYEHGRPRQVQLVVLRAPRWSRSPG